MSDCYSVSASAVDFHGYARAGINYSSQGGNAYCMNKSLVGRLGNECDAYFELGLVQELYNKANNKFTLHTLLAFDTKQSGDGNNSIDWQGNNWQDGRAGHGSWGGMRWGMEELYADYEMPSGMTLWAGKRFYKRKDIHILDYYYSHSSGFGVGIDNIALNNLGSLSFAFMKSQTDVGAAANPVDTNMNSYKLDARWDGIPLWADATLDIDLIYAWQNLSENQKHLGTDDSHNNPSFMGMIEWTQGNFFGGFNKLSFTFATNGFDNLGLIGEAGDSGSVAFPYPTRGKAYRVIDWGVIEQSKWNLGYAVLFGHLSNDDANKGWTAAGKTSVNNWTFIIRPSYKWSDYTSTVLEYGYSNIAGSGRTWQLNKNDDRVSASKLTIAQQWSPSTQFWARPSIRVFASWLSGSLMSNQLTGYRDDNHEYIFGAQMEAWW